MILLGIEILTIILAGILYFYLNKSFKQGMCKVDTANHEVSHCIIQEYYLPGTVREIEVYNRLHISNLAECIVDLTLAMIKQRKFISVRKFNFGITFGSTWNGNIKIQDPFSRMVMLQGGYEGEKVLDTEEQREHTISIGDHETIQKIMITDLKISVESPEFEETLIKVKKEAKRIIENNKEIANKLGEVLLNKGKLKRKEIKDIIDKSGGLIR